MSEYIAYDGDKILINVPYNIEFLTELKNSIGDRKWDSGRKIWVLNKKDEEAIKEMITRHFGVSGLVSETKVIRIRAKGDLERTCTFIEVGGFPLVRATGRDSGAKVCKGVTHIEGKISSGGSAKNWKTIVSKGSVFDIVVPIDYKLNDSDYEEITSTDKERENLIAERESLIRRIAEIDTLLA